TDPALHSRTGDGLRAQGPADHHQFGSGGGRAPDGGRHLTRLTHRMSDQGPTVFNERYELHRKLARGGMSDVYLARDLLLDRPVAVKVLFPEYAKDPTFVERFRREAQAAANLNHPNIVAIYDWGQQSGTYFIVMEY